MGAKAWFAAYFDTDPKEILSKKPRLDRPESTALANKMFSGYSIQEKEEGTLDFLNMGKNEAFVGVYGDLKIIAHNDFGGDFPSQINPHWLTRDLGSTIYIHATHSAVDWFAFALWKEGQLLRSTSVSPDGGVQEDIGEKLSFEAPYWDGCFPLEDDFEDEPYPLPFHPLELSETALLAMLGFQFEGHPKDWVCDPMEIPIMKFQVYNKVWWKFWA